MATKTFNLGSSGCAVISGGSGTASSTSDTGFNIKLSSDSAYFRGIRINLAEVFGSEDVTINSVTISFKAYGEKTSSIYNKGTAKSGHYSTTFTQNVSHSEAIGRGSGNVTTFSDKITDCSDWKRYSSSMAAYVICPCIQIINPNSITTDTYHISNISFIVDYTLPSYYLDFNGLLDGASSGGISPYGTADVYINGSLVSSGCSDFYQQIEYGSTYEIKNIKANDGYIYNGVSSGSLSGTITGTTSVVLSFSKIKPPEFTSASLTYADAQVSASNKVPAGEHCILSVGVS